MVNGIRVPDDETDVVVHRGGRFINNQYVPHQSSVPREMAVRAELGRAGRSYQSGEEFYQNNDYTFSPVQHYEQQQQQGLPTVLEADQDDFVIQEQTASVAGWTREAREVPPGLTGNYLLQYSPV